MRLAELLLTADVSRRNQSLVAHIVLHGVRCVVCVEGCGARLDLIEVEKARRYGTSVFRHQSPLDPLLLQSHASRLYLNTLRGFSPVFFDYWGTFR